MAPIRTRTIRRGPFGRRRLAVAAGYAVLLGCFAGNAAAADSVLGQVTGVVDDTTSAVAGTTETAVEAVTAAAEPVVEAAPAPAAPVDGGSSEPAAPVPVGEVVDTATSTVGDVTGTVEAAVEQTTAAGVGAVTATADEALEVAAGIAGDTVQALDETVAGLEPFAQLAAPLATGWTAATPAGTAALLESSEGASQPLHASEDVPELASQSELGPWPTTATSWTAPSGTPIPPPSWPVSAVPDSSGLVESAGVVRPPARVGKRSETPPQHDVVAAADENLAGVGDGRDPPEAGVGAWGAVRPSSDGGRAEGPMPSLGLVASGSSASGGSSQTPAAALASPLAVPDLAQGWVTWFDAVVEPKPTLLVSPDLPG